jgi:hypothetical protein
MVRVIDEPSPPSASTELAVFQVSTCDFEQQ